MRRLYTGLLTMVVSACSAAPGTSVTRAAIIGGVSDPGDPAVVLLRGHLANGSDAICSATIVAPTVALTAAHCVDPRAVGSVTAFDLFLGSDLDTQGTDPTRFIAVTRTAFDPAFDPQALPAGHDVGVALLATAAPVTPLPINRAPLTAASRGALLRVIGFGITSAGDVNGTTVGVKRVVVTPLTSYDSLLVYFGSNGANTCEGDSGGPALLSISGVEMLAGLTSYGPSDCGGLGADTRADTIGYAFAAPYLPPGDMGGSDLAESHSTTAVAPPRAGDDVMPPRGGCAITGAGGGGDPLGLLLFAAWSWRRRRYGR